MTAHNNALRRTEQKIKRAVGRTIALDLKDPRIGMASVVDVDLSPDYRHANIYISVLGDEEEMRATFEGLKSARGFVRSELGEKVRMKYVPEIHFIQDRSIERGARIEEILKRIRKDREES